MKRSLKETLSGKTAPEHTQEDLSNDANVLINKFSGMSESELMSELLSATQKQKEEGTFDRSSIQKGMDVLMPMLNESQREKLISILGKL